jgi:hypothetical protein
MTEYLFLDGTRGLTLSRLSISNEFALDALLASLEGTGELSVSGEYISLAAKHNNHPFNTK